MWRLLLAKQNTEPNSASRPLASALRPVRFADLEIFDFATRFYGSSQPARLLPAARPCFGRSLWIAIFWKDPRVFTSGLTVSVVGLRSICPLDAAIEHCQALFKLTLFGTDPWDRILLICSWSDQRSSTDIVSRSIFFIDMLRPYISSFSGFNVILLGRLFCKWPASHYPQRKIASAAGKKLKGADRCL